MSPNPLLRPGQFRIEMVFLNAQLFRGTMPIYKRPYKRARYGKKLKYSVQQKAIAFSASVGNTTQQVIVPATDTEGMRKVKNITVNLSGAGNVIDFYWALVYVPQGTTPGTLNITAAATAPAMYEPNQFVMNCGIVDANAGPIRFFTPLARNLNDGDTIYLLIRPTGLEPLDLHGVVRYAITLQ